MRVGRESKSPEVNPGEHGEDHIKVQYAATGYTRGSLRSRQRRRGKRKESDGKS